MATQPLSSSGLTLQLEATSKETIVRCKGKIIAENSEAFQRQIRDLIPESRAQNDTITRRIIIDLSHVTHVDSTGLGAVLCAWSAAQKKDATLKLPT